MQLCLEGRKAPNSLTKLSPATGILISKRQMLWFIEPCPRSSPLFLLCKPPLQKDAQQAPVFSPYQGGLNQSLRKPWLLPGGGVSLNNPHQSIFAMDVVTKRP